MSGQDLELVITVVVTAHDERQALDACAGLLRRIGGRIVQTRDCSDEEPGCWSLTVFKESGESAEHSVPAALTRAVRRFVRGLGEHFPTPKVACEPPTAWTVLDDVHLLGPLVQGAERVLVEAWAGGDPLRRSPVPAPRAEHPPTPAPTTFAEPPAPQSAEPVIPAQPDAAPPAPEPPAAPEQDAEPPRAEPQALPEATPTAETVGTVGTAEPRTAPESDMPQEPLAAPARFAPAAPPELLATPEPFTPQGPPASPEFFAPTAPQEPPATPEFLAPAAPQEPLATPEFLAPAALHEPLAAPESLAPASAATPPEPPATAVSPEAPASPAAPLLPDAQLPPEAPVSPAAPVSPETQVSPAAQGSPEAPPVPPPSPSPAAPQRPAGPTGSAPTWAGAAAAWPTPVWPAPVWPAPVPTARTERGGVTPPPTGFPPGVEIPAISAVPATPAAPPTPAAPTEPPTTPFPVLPPAPPQPLPEPAPLPTPQDEPAPAPPEPLSDSPVRLILEIRAITDPTSSPEEQARSVARGLAPAGKITRVAPGGRLLAVHVDLGTSEASPTSALLDAAAAMTPDGWSGVERVGVSAVARWSAGPAPTTGVTSLELTATPLSAFQWTPPA